jgi:hypothetical protein
MQFGMQKFLWAAPSHCLAQNSWHDGFCANAGTGADVAMNPNASRIGSNFDMVSPQLFGPIKLIA